MQALMKWDDVPIFLSIARAGSLSGAASALSVTHSTVYRRLAALEDALGCRLFTRSSGRYRLSAVGEEVLGHAEAAEAALLSMERSVQAAATRPSGSVTLTAPEPLLPLIAPHLAPFRTAYPEIALSVRFSDRFYDLTRGEADVAVRPVPRPPEGVVGRRVAGVAWSIYGLAGMDPEQCSRVPWADYGEELARLEAARWQADQPDGGPVMLSVNSVPAMQAVIAEAGCRGLLPCFVGDPDPRLQRLSPPIPEAASALWLLVHPQLRRSPAIRALLDHLWDALRDEVPLLEGRSQAVG